MTVADSTPPSLAWLTGPTPHVTLSEMHKSGELAKVLPEVDVLYGIPQNELYHPEIDTGIHIELSLQASALITDDPKVRFAVLVHDLGKGLTAQDQWPAHVNHEHAGIEPVKAVCKRFGVPPVWEQLAVLVCEHHLKIHQVFSSSPRAVLRLIKALGFETDVSLETSFLQAVEADKRGRAGHLHHSYDQSLYLQEAFSQIRAHPMPDDSAASSKSFNDGHTARLRVVGDVLKKHLARRAVELKH